MGSTANEFIIIAFCYERAGLVAMNDGKLHQCSYINEYSRSFFFFFCFFTHIETNQSVGGAKTGVPGEKPPDTPASRTWLIPHVTRAPNEAQTHSGVMIEWLSALKSATLTTRPRGPPRSSLLAHLSRRLTRWAYRMAMIRCPSVRRPSVVHNFKDLLLWNRLADLVEILCGASLDSGISSLIAKSRSHDQDGRHAHIW